MGISVDKADINEWTSLLSDQKGHSMKPFSLHLTSESMSPYIRMNTDTVVVAPCRVEDVRVGDIVLIRASSTLTGAFLHRLYKIRNGNLITIGDNMRRLDREVDASRLIGRAVSVTGPGKELHCDRRFRRLQGKLIVKTYKIRPLHYIFQRLFV